MRVLIVLLLVVSQLGEFDAGPPDKADNPPAKAEPYRQHHKADLNHYVGKATR